MAEVTTVIVVMMAIIVMPAVIANHDHPFPDHPFFSPAGGSGGNPDHATETSAYDGAIPAADNGTHSRAGSRPDGPADYRVTIHSGGLSRGGKTDQHRQCHNPHALDHLSSPSRCC
jgi:hypothetical protein